MRLGSTPRLTRKSLIARARRSPRPRLYSDVPRGSQLPSTRKATERLRSCVSHSAKRRNFSCSDETRSDLSSSKKTILASARNCSAAGGSFVSGVVVRGRSAIGGGAGSVTLTRALAVALPPSPNAVAVYVVETRGLTSRSPEPGTSPMPLMVTILAFSVDQRNVVFSPRSRDDLSALKVAVGAGAFVVATVTVALSRASFLPRLATTSNLVVSFGITLLPPSLSTFSPLRVISLAFLVSHLTVTGSPDLMSLRETDSLAVGFAQAPNKIAKTITTR